MRIENKNRVVSASFGAKNRDGSVAVQSRLFPCDDLVFRSLRSSKHQAFSMKK